MVVLDRRNRKGPVLTPSSIPCLSGIPTVNITEGCAHGCLYCYTQGYSNYPGRDRVVLFENTPDMVRAELARKRHRTRRVYFSPSSDAFQPLPEVQEITYRTMAILLEAGVEVSFLTKGAIGERFLDLFARTPSLVFAQIGITTLEDRLWRALEPGTASPSRRLENIDALAKIGVATETRLDPLIPDLTDTEADLTSLLSELQRRGVGSIAASYLFLRSAFAGRLSEQVRALQDSPIPIDGWTWRPLADGVGGGAMIGPEERRQRFSRLQALASRHGIEVHVCTCKNPDLGTVGGCQIAGPSQPAPRGEVLPLLLGEASQS